MKEVVGTAMNVSLVVNEKGKLEALVEAIIVTSEPTYSFDCGELQRKRIPETMRFMASTKTLRTMAKTFDDWASIAEELEAKHTPKTDEMKQGA